MLLFGSPSTRQLSLGLLVLRIAAGAVFINHGGQKLFVYGFAGVTGAFTQMGVPMPGIMGPFIALLEFFGGLALIVGLLSRLAALGLAFDMIGAILLVHLKGGFFLPAGYEFALTLLAASLAIAVGGPGALSVDAAIARRRGDTVTAL